MQALVLDGALRDGTALEGVRSAVCEELQTAGHTVESCCLRDADIGICVGCFGCWVRTPGECVQNDDGRRIAEAAVCSDLIVLLTPVTFGGYSSALKKALDRMMPLLSPFFMRIDGEVRHRARYARYPRLAVIGCLDDPDPEAEEIFAALVGRNAVNLHCPSYAVSFVHAEDDLSTRMRKIAEVFETSEVTP